MLRATPGKLRTGSARRGLTVAWHEKHVGNLTYGVCFTGGQPQRPIVFVDFHHNDGYADDPRFRNAISALRAFKNGAEDVVERLGEAMATIAAADFEYTRVTHVFPALGHADREPDPDSGTYRAAQLVAAALDVPLDVETFHQIGERRTLHGRRRNAAQRRELVLETLRCRAARGRRILLVDDIFTTGTTQECYGELVSERGGVFVGGVVLMKYENEQPLWNRHLYE